MKTQKFITLIILSLLSLGAFAQDLRDRNFVPLYDCSIFAAPQDRSQCFQVKAGQRFDYEDQGYAVDCYSFRSDRRNNCLSLADQIYQNDQAFDCRALYNDPMGQRQCQSTRRGYRDGSFDRVQPTRSTTVVTSSYNSGVCDASYYDRAYSAWQIQYEKQKKRGKTKATIGILSMIGGAILSTSRNSGTAAVGQGLMIGGAFVTAWGLIEIADADLNLPYANPACRDNYLVETRMVVVEKRECITTRYTEHGWNSSRSYYEIRCEDRKYVTFQEFKPWYEGRETTYYYNY